MVRYDQAYNNKIARTVANFNRKVARLQKAGLTNIPSKVSIKDIKNRFDNRSDINYYLRDLQRFSKRGAEKTVTINGREFTQYDIEIFRRRLKTERARVRKDIEEAMSQKPTYPMRHDIYTANLRTRQAKLSENWQDILVSRIGQKIKDEPVKRNEIYDNYLEVLFQDAYVMDYDEEKLMYIRDKLVKLKPRQFIKALENDPNIQLIFDYYHSLTRTGSEIDATDAFDELYKNIDAIVAQYS